MEGIKASVGHRVCRTLVSGGHARPLRLLEMSCFQGRSVDDLAGTRFALGFRQPGWPRRAARARADVGNPGTLEKTKARDDEARWILDGTAVEQRSGM
jgi:hypothetical protein